jgi:hypothetical protein
MTERDKSSTAGEATGAVAGALAGGALGAAAGPIGAVIGAAAGGFVGTKTAEGIAEAPDRDAYTQHFSSGYSQAPYFRSGSEWRDYDPAYQYGYDTFARHSGRRFEEIEPELARDWDRSRQRSRLGWNEARDAVRDGWDYLGRAKPAPGS